MKKILSVLALGLCLMLICSAALGEITVTKKDMALNRSLDKSVNNVLMLMQDYTALLGGSIVSYGAGDIAEMTIETAQKSATLTFTGSSTELIVKNGDAALDKEAVSAVLQSLNQIVPYAELTGNMQTEPALSMTILLRSGTQERIELSDIGQGLYAVSINGTANFATGSDSFAQLDALLDTL